MHILGIDPGTATVGFGVIEAKKDQYKVLDYGCITTKPHQDLTIRLNEIIKDLKVIIKTWKPKAVAIEEIFFNKNVKTAIQVAQARGAILYELSRNKYQIGEYKPQQVKEAVCGYGKAQKKQVQKMVQIILKLKTIPKPDDAADALALAICHAQHLVLLNKIKS
jgi:crossover junction endodeoxyribonuclease RuvC